MRKRLIISLALATLGPLAAAVTASAVLSPTLVGPDGNTQSIAVNITPKKLSKTMKTPATLEVKTATSSRTNANGVPSPAVRGDPRLRQGDEDLRQGVPDLRSPQDREHLDRRSRCAPARTRKSAAGSRQLCCRSGKQVFNVEQTVTAFNGEPEGGHPIILLHTYGTTPVTVTAVLVGTGDQLQQGRLRPAPRPGDPADRRRHRRPHRLPGEDQENLHVQGEEAQLRLLDVQTQEAEKPAASSSSRTANR